MVRAKVPDTGSPGAREEAAPMEKLAAQAAQALEGAVADEIIAWAARTFGDRLCVTSSMTDAEQDAELGPDLYARNPDLCCYLRKVVPLEQALERYDAWITGVRREETAARTSTRAVEWDARRQKVKVNPIVAWSQADVDAYIAEHGVLVNPLVDEGYPSIGCRTCTARVAPGADPRSGRWAGTAKTECGIHT